MDKEIKMELRLQLKELILKYRSVLRSKIDERLKEMQEDMNEHYFLYQALGINDDEGGLIDEYQNKGRFLYKYAGSFLEEAVILCFEHAFENTKRKIKIANSSLYGPKTFEIDCLVNDTMAYEIKWRDATTDGDHIAKERTRLKCTKENGYIPVRLMFYYPNRKQAIKIQNALKTLYLGLGGEYYVKEHAWEYIKATTGIDLYGVLNGLITELNKE